MEELIIQLQKPIKISTNGQFREVEVLNIPLPSVQYFNLYASVKEIVTKAMFELQDKLDNTSSNNNEDSEELKNFPLDIFLASGKSEELSKSINNYLEILAKWDNEIKVTSNHIKKLSIADYKEILERVSYFLYIN